MRPRWFLVSLSMIVACGDNLPAVPTGPPLALANGSRLHAAWLATADGQKVAPIGGGWFDTELGIPCRLGRADDGVTRCLPETGGVGQAAGALQFADAACTTIAVFIDESPDLPPCSTRDAFSSGWAQMPPRDGVACLQDFSYARVTSMEGPLQDFARDDGGACTAQGTKPGFTVSAPVPASTFVAFAAPVPVTPAAMGRLQPTVQVADDGARDARGIFDTQRGEACNPGDPGDGSLRCVPSIEQIDRRLFVDDACTQAVAVDPTNQPSCTVLVPKVVRDASSATIALFDLGAAIATPATLYRQLAGGGCEVEPSPPPGVLHVVGASLPVDTFVELHDIVVVGDRIVEHGLAGPDGTLVVRNRSLHDTMLDQDVSAVHLGTSSIALVPDTFADTDEFSDAECTQPVADLATAPFALAEFEAGAEGSDGCPVTSFFEVGDEIHPSLVFEKGDTCGPGVPPAHHVFPLGAPLPASTFVSVNETTD